MRNCRIVVRRRGVRADRLREPPLLFLRLLGGFDRRVVITTHPTATAASVPPNAHFATATVRGFVRDASHASAAHPARSRRRDRPGGGNRRA